MRRVSGAWSTKAEVPTHAPAMSGSSVRCIDWRPADVVIFDAKKVLDEATYAKPFEAPIGIVHVFVNGEQVV